MMGKEEVTGLLRTEGCGGLSPTVGTVGSSISPRTSHQLGEVVTMPILYSQTPLIDCRVREEVALERNAIRRVVCKAIINNPSKAAHKALLEVIDGINDLAGYETQATKRRRGKRGVAIR